MLAAQMAAVHVATMLTAKRLVSSKPPMQDVFERALNRLARTFTAQVEALNHYRSREEQNITHVSVAQGGQASVENTQAPSEKVPQTPPPSSPPCTAKNGHSNSNIARNGHYNSNAEGRANRKTRSLSREAH